PSVDPPRDPPCGPGTPPTTPDVRCRPAIDRHPARARGPTLRYRMAGRLENAEIAEVFVEMADLTQIVGGDEHRIRAFRNAARVIESLPEDVTTAIQHNMFEKTPGIGPGTVRRVKQILRTGTCEDLEDLRRRLPPGLRELLDVHGIGASTARRLW